MRNFRKHEKGESGVCGTSASMKKEKVVFAELPQASKSRKWRLRNFRKHEKVESGVCGTSASVKKEKTALAELLQTPKRRKWPLQDFCKRQKGENGLCRTSASVKKEKMAFAGLLQTSKWRKRPLQNFCKRQNGENGLCRTSASAKKEKMAFAEVLQAFPKTFWPSRGLRRGSLLAVCLPRTHVISVKACRAGTFLLLLRGQKTDGLTDKHKKENGKDFSGIRHGKRRLRSAYL